MILIKVLIMFRIKEKHPKYEYFIFGHQSRFYAFIDKPVAKEMCPYNGFEREEKLFVVFSPRAFSSYFSYNDS